MKNTEKNIREDITNHWSYTKKIIMKMLDLVETAYIESGVHQYGHGREDTFNELKHLLPPEAVSLWNQNHNLDDA